MIVFDKLWVTMKEKGFTTYTLRVKCEIDSKLIQRLKKNMNVTTETLDKLCTILDCELHEIATYKKSL